MASNKTITRIEAKGPWLDLDLNFKKLRIVVILIVPSLKRNTVSDHAHDHYISINTRTGFYFFLMSRVIYPLTTSFQGYLYPIAVSLLVKGKRETFGTRLFPQLQKCVI